MWWTPAVGVELSDKGAEKDPKSMHNILCAYCPHRGAGATSSLGVPSRGASSRDVVPAQQKFTDSESVGQSPLLTPGHRPEDTKAICVRHTQTSAPAPQYSQLSFANGAALSVRRTAFHLGKCRSISA